MSRTGLGHSRRKVLSSEEAVMKSWGGGSSGGQHKAKKARSREGSGGTQGRRVRVDGRDSDGQRAGS